MKSKYKSSIYAIGILLLAIVVAHMGYWIYITTQYDTFFESKAAYLTSFPVPLQNALLLTVINIYLLGMSIFIFLQSIKVNYLKWLSIGLLLFSSFLAVWNIFTLM